MEWQDENHGHMLGGSETELYVATANTIDRIKEALKQGILDGIPIRAVIFTVLNRQEEMLLWQAGEVSSVYNLAQIAAQQALKSVQDEERDDGSPA